MVRTAAVLLLLLLALWSYSCLLVPVPVSGVWQQELPRLGATIARKTAEHAPVIQRAIQKSIDQGLPPVAATAWGHAKKWANEWKEDMREKKQHERRQQQQQHAPLAGPDARLGVTICGAAVSSILITRSSPYVLIA